MSKEPENKQPENKADQDLRIFRRVPVNLRAAVVVGRDEVYLANTVDISEGGVRLEHYFGPALRKGRLVGVNLQGVVSASSENDDDEHFLMRVVRCEEDLLALRFADSKSGVNKRDD